MKICHQSELNLWPASFEAGNKKVERRDTEENVLQQATQLTVKNDTTAMVGLSMILFCIRYRRLGLYEIARPDSKGHKRAWDDTSAQTKRLRQ